MSKYQHTLSVVEDKAPTANDIKLGEIAVNLFAGKEKMYVKNSSNNIVAFPVSYSKSEIDTAISANTTAINSEVSRATNAESTIDAKFDGVVLKKITQSAYNALQTKDANTLYIITD